MIEIMKVITWSNVILDGVLIGSIGESEPIVKKRDRFQADYCPGGIGDKCLGDFASMDAAKAAILAEHNKPK